MGSEQEAKLAIDELNGRELGGRPLTVNEAQERSSGGGNRSSGGNGRGRW
jgi:RNA recognition motif-containing protein